MVSDAVAQHMAAVRELSKSGQALAPNAPTATTQNPAWWFEGEPTPARDRLHRRLLHEARAAAPDVEQQRQAIILAGPPGAGKSTVLSDVLGAHRDKYLVVDADEFKRSLLREAQADGSCGSWLMPDAIRARQAAGERFYPLELASLVHEESSYLAKDLRSEARNTPAETYTATPKAHPATHQLKTSSTVRTDRVDTAGKVSLRHGGKMRHLGIGRAHKGQPVRMLIDHDNVIVTEIPNGTILAEFTIDLTRDYQPKKIRPRQKHRDPTFHER